MLDKVSPSDHQVWNRFVLMRSLVLTVQTVDRMESWRVQNGGGYHSLLAVLHHSLLCNFDLSEY